MHARDLARINQREVQEITDILWVERAGREKPLDGRKLLSSRKHRQCLKKKPTAFDRRVRRLLELCKGRLQTWRGTSMGRGLSGNVRIQARKVLGPDDLNVSQRSIDARRDSISVTVDLSGEMSGRKGRTP